MAKKKKGKVVQMLSPENYIRQKARTLPIHECRVNANWQDSGMANLIVSRKHTNGNVTIGLFLVDIFCLGVKDAHYRFNISDMDYREFIDNFESQLPVEIISYTLAHNIVYSAIEFAEDFGFKPHPKFTSVAQYMLEEDTDDIELIDIECGKNGKALYVRSPYDSNWQAKSIIDQLERTAGPGNYDFIDTLDEGFNDELFEDDFEDDNATFSGFEESMIKDSNTFQFKVTLNGIKKPPVWRRVTVPSYYTFMHLHFVLQVVMGWENSHLYQFSEKRFGSETVITEIYEDLDPGDQQQVEAKKTPLSQIFKKEGDKFVYVYDFGDSWEHTITLEKIIPKASKIPELLDGKGACPPEDCGGVWGYENMLQALADKNDPENQEYRDWLELNYDEEWNPNEFDVALTDHLLSTLFTK
jgi:hypothetical protein